jgi:hypothetical protein
MYGYIVEGGFGLRGKARRSVVFREKLERNTRERGGLFSDFFFG